MIPPVRTHEVPQPPQPAPQPAPSVKVPVFLETASKITKCVAAILLAIAGIGCLLTGSLIASFAPEVGIGTAALSVPLFALAHYLYQN